MKPTGLIVRELGIQESCCGNLQYYVCHALNIEANQFVANLELTGKGLPGTRLTILTIMQKAQWGLQRHRRSHCDP